MAQDKKEPEPKTTDEFKAVPTSTTTVPYKCGHTFAQSFELNCYGRYLVPEKNYLKTRTKCGDCMVIDIKPAIIRCCLCGFPLIPGSPVAIYCDKWSFRSDRKIVDCNGIKHALGCMGWDCCPSGGHFGGHWDGEKFVPYFRGSMAMAATAYGTEPKQSFMSKVVKALFG